MEAPTGKTFEDGNTQKVITQTLDLDKDGKFVGNDTYPAVAIPQFKGYEAQVLNTSGYKLSNNASEVDAQFPYLIHNEQLYNRKVVYVKKAITVARTITMYAPEGKTFDNGKSEEVIEQPITYYPMGNPSASHFNSVNLPKFEGYSATITDINGKEIKNATKIAQQDNDYKAKLTNQYDLTVRYEKLKPEAKTKIETKEVTRTIKDVLWVTERINPENHDGAYFTKTIKQTVKFEREVTTDPDGKVTYGEWKLASGSPKEWASYVPEGIPEDQIKPESRHTTFLPYISGTSKVLKEIPAQEVTPDTKDKVIEIVYVAGIKKSQDFTYTRVIHDEIPNQEPKVTTQQVTVENVSIRPDGGQDTTISFKGGKIDGYEVKEIPGYHIVITDQNGKILNSINPVEFNKLSDFTDLVGGDIGVYTYKTDLYIKYIPNSTPSPDPDPTPVDPDPIPQPHPEPTPTDPTTPDKPDTPNEDVPKPHPTDTPDKPEEDNPVVPTSPETVRPHANRIDVKTPAEKTVSTTVAPKANELPQTGSKENKVGILGLAIASIASVFGLAAGKKRKN